MATITLELVQLINQSESMNEADKKYWKDQLPDMTVQQAQRLYGILRTEKRKMAELEVKFQQAKLAAKRARENMENEEMTKAIEAIDSIQI